MSYCGVGVVYFSLAVWDGQQNPLFLSENIQQMEWLMVLLVNASKNGEKSPLIITRYRVLIVAYDG